jgi:hypothetical protein
MKFKMYLLRSVIIIVTFFMSFVACQSGEQKEQNAVNDVAEAEQNLKEVAKENDADKKETATADQWKKFKEETDAKIQENEIKMKALSDQMKAKGKKIDDLYARKIDTLQMKNELLKNKIDNYDMKSDWNQFQEEFNRDMDQLGKTLKEFTVNNKQ